MGYPLAPDATSADPFAFWWSVARPGGTHVCSGNWAGLRNAFGGDDAATLNELVGLADALNSAQPADGWNRVADTLRADLAARRWSRLAIQVALWREFYQGSGQRLDALSIDSRATLPAWNAASASPAPFVCWVPATQQNPAAYSGAELAAARAASKYGFRLAPGETPPLLPDDVASGPAGPTVVIGVALVLGLLALAFVSAPGKAR